MRTAPPTQGQKDGPRCLAPMKYQETARPRYDLHGPVCWRPQGHPPGRHMSRASWERAQEYRRGYVRPGKRTRQQYQEAA